MAFGSRLKAVEAQLAGYRASHNRADQRLDRTGPALAQALGDTVLSHEGGRSSGVTMVKEGYQLVVSNDPFTPTVTLVATVHDVPSATWLLTSGDQADFDPDTLEAMEKWTVGAKTGIPVDDERHAKRAAFVNQA